MIDHLRAACRTNSAQVSAVLVFSAPLVVSCVFAARPVPMWAWLAACLLWPAMAFMLNVFQPIPRE